MSRFGPESGVGFTVTADEADRFRSLVATGEGCWEWRGRINPSGYGAFYFPRLRRTGGLAAHRVAYAIEHGAVPAGRVVMHTCDNKGCVRPDHLQVGTQTENIRDAVAKGIIAPASTTCRLCGEPRIDNRGQALCAQHFREYQKHYTSISRARRRFFATLKREAALKSLRQRLPFVPPSTMAGMVARVGKLRWVEMFARRFGFYDHDASSLTVIGRHFGISGERVRQILVVVDRRMEAA